jgi:hypothetical protein
MLAGRKGPPQKKLVKVLYDIRGKLPGRRLLW